jgi:hypothetical protein
VAALTPAHRAALDECVAFCSERLDVAAVVLTGSWARGVADPRSDMDVAVLAHGDREELERDWSTSAECARADELLRPIVRYSAIDLDVFGPGIEPGPRGWTSGPDDFELRIGNWIAYGEPLLERGNALAALRARLLPYYDDDLRRRRLDEVLVYCRNNLDHIPWALGRGDRFHAFNRLYHAAQELLQALFMTRRVYPVAYDKWVEQQLRDLLDLPDVATQLADALDIERVREGAAIVETLLDEHVRLASPPPAI